MEITTGERVSLNSLLSKDEVQALLKALMNGSITVLKPEFNQSGDLTYPDAERIMGCSSRFAMEILEALSREGLLVKELITGVLSCPYCGCSKFIFELIDTYHASAPMSKAIENIASGLLGKRLICTSGRHTFYESEGVSRKIHSYKLNEEKKDFLSKWLMDIGPVVEKLKAKGWRVESPARMMGKSKVEHTFALSVSFNRGKEDDIDAVIDLIVSDILVDESALSAVLKAMDVKADKKLLFIVPGLTDKAKALFDYHAAYGVYVLECENVNQVYKALLEVLSSLAKIKLKTASGVQ